MRDPLNSPVPKKKKSRSVVGPQPGPTKAKNRIVSKLARRKSPSRSLSAARSSSPATSTTSRTSSKASKGQVTSKRSASTCTTEPTPRSSPGISDIAPSKPSSPTTQSNGGNGLKSFSPHSRHLVSETKSEFRVNISTVDGFPDNNKSTSTVLTIYRSVARKDGNANDLKRITNDKTFRKNVTKVVSHRDVRSSTAHTDSHRDSRYGVRFLTSVRICVASASSWYLPSTSSPP